MASRTMTASAVAVASVTPWLVWAGTLVSTALLALGRRSVALRGFAVVGSVQLARRAALRRAGGVHPRRHRAPRAAGPTTRDRLCMRLLTANLWNGAAGVEGIAEEVEGSQPDLVVLQEVTPRHLRAFDELGTFALYRARAVSPEPGHAGLGVWSRRELSAVEWVVVCGEPQLRVWVELGSARVRLYAVHAPAPVPSKVTRWSDWFTAMAQETEREMASHPHPVVLAGDLNATTDHRAFRRLLRAGLHDTARTGEGPRAMTWPARWRALPALVRIDHVLVRSNVHVEAYRVGRGQGSDHRPVTVDLCVEG